MISLTVLFNAHGFYMAYPEPALGLKKCLALYQNILRFDAVFDRFVIYTQKTHTFSKNP